MYRIRYFTALLLIAGLAGSALDARAQEPEPQGTDAVQANPGDLDLSFGAFAGNGKTAGTPIDVFAVALQADDKIVVAGSKNNTFGLARYNPDGTLDPSFGSGGVVETLVFSQQSRASASAVAIQPDGKIVAAGYVTISGGDDFALVRLLPNGAPDPTFSGNGRAYSDFDDGDDWASAIAIQADGRIVVAGAVYDRETLASDDFDFGVMRFNPDGALDPTFSGDGKTNIGFGEDDYGTAIALQPDGKIIVAGYFCDKPIYGGDCTFYPDNDFAVVRLNTNGSLDISFDNDGKATAGLGDTDHAEAVALTGDGKIVVAGDSGYSKFALARFLSNGSLDSTFDGDGKLTVQVGNASLARGVVIQPDGKIVAAGYGNGQFALARFNSSGALDSTFGGDGMVFTDFLSSRSEIAYALAMQPDGRLVAVGTDGDNTSLRGYLARYFPDGSLDAGGRQLVAFGLPIGDEEAYALAVQPDGKIVVAGYKEESSRQFALARLDSEGKLDPTFDGDGRLTFGFGGEERAQAVALQQDGHIVVAGYVSSPSQGDNFMIARFEPDGTFACFNVTDFAGGDDRVYGVAIQPDQKIVAAGLVHGGTNFDFGIARYNTNCSIDRSFGDGDGELVIGFGGGDSARAVVVEPDGDIVVAGYASQDIALVRVTPAGQLDSTFGSGGKVVTDLGGFERANALARLANGQLVVAGTKDSDFVVLRYHLDGSLDTAFGTNGSSAADLGAFDTALAVAARGDGTIIAAGCGTDVKGIPLQFEVAQFRPDGSLDTAFSGDGRVVTLFGEPRGCAYGVAFTPDNKVVAAGMAVAHFYLNFALAQYVTTPSVGSLYRVFLPAVMK